MQTIKAIETIYNGYRFRSRLEARWAVFFDTLGIAYEYEKEGFDLDGIWYLPDFYLPKLDCWIEIKGQPPTQDEQDKVEKLASATGKDVYLFYGEIPSPLEISRGIVSESMSAYRIFSDGGADCPYLWCECPVCGLLGIQFSGYSDRLSCGHVDGRTFGDQTPRMIAAYTAARQARFEHGERP